MFAAAKKVDNIIATIDYNKQQIDGPIEKVMDLGDLAAKWTSFGWKVLEMQGNDMQSVIETMAKAKSLCHQGQPIVVLMHTEMGAGVDFMMGTHKWHGVAPNDEQLKTALAQLPETLGDYR
jgi:transketolase